MLKNPKAVSNLKPNATKLIKYGFQKEDERFVYRKDILGGDFTFNVFVSGFDTYLEVIDNFTGEEYALVFVKSTVGAFVGSIREECERIFNDIILKCYEKHIFKTDYAYAVMSYIEKTYGVEAEFLWEETPNNAIFRDTASKKWFVALLTVAREKIGLEGGGNAEILDLKGREEDISAFLNTNKYLPAYHMNKKHWYTVVLDGSVKLEEIFKRIDESFKLVAKKK